MATKVKHDNFVGKSMRGKGVTDIPGIAEVLGGKLEAKGFGSAEKMLGQYLLMGRDETKFIRWVKETCDADAGQAKNCCNALREWCDNFL